MPHFLIVVLSVTFSYFYVACHIFLLLCWVSHFLSVMLSHFIFVIQNDVIPSVVMLNVIMLSVVAPHFWPPKLFSKVIATFVKSGLLQNLFLWKWDFFGFLWKGFNLVIGWNLCWLVGNKMMTAGANVLKLFRCNFHH